MTRRPSCLAVAVLLLAAHTVVRAHHSYAAVEMTKRATVQGTVMALEWTNPHVWVWIVVADGRGATVPYAFEATSPSELTRFFGWNKRVMTPGQPITVEYAPFRNGDHGGALQAITFADGRGGHGRSALGGRGTPAASERVVPPAAPKEGQ
jgi:hypothetical protein